MFLPPCDDVVARIRKYMEEATSKEVDPNWYRDYRNRVELDYALEVAATRGFWS